MTNCKKNSILFVDDEKDIIFLMTKLFSSFYDITSSNSGEDAIKIFMTDPLKFDVIVTDYMMYNMNGLDLIKEIKEINKNILTVLCAGYVDSGITKTADKLKVNLILTKPIIFNNFQNEINKLIIGKNDDKI